MRSILTTCAVLAALSACGGGSDSSVSVFKSHGSLQCSGGGVTMAALQEQLAAAKVQVRSTQCGSTASPNAAALCGAPDGRIGIFHIPADQAAAAGAAGFAPLSTLSQVRTVPCG